MKHIKSLAEFRKRLVESGLRQEILDLFLDLTDDGYSVVMTSDKNDWIDWSLTKSNNISSDKIGLYSDRGIGMTVGIHPSMRTPIRNGNRQVLIDKSLINVLKFAESYAKKELGIEIAQIYVSKPYSYRYYKSIDSIPMIDEVNGVEIMFRFIEQ